MNKQFVSYALALKLKELGFNDECFGLYNPELHLHFTSKNSVIDMDTNDKNVVCSAPTWQQAFDFLLPKLHRVCIHYHGDQSGRFNHGVTGFISSFTNKEEAIEQLIDLVKRNNIKN